MFHRLEYPHRALRRRLNGVSVWRGALAVALAISLPASAAAEERIWSAPPRYSTASSAAASEPAMKVLSSAVAVTASPAFERAAVLHIELPPPDAAFQEKVRAHNRRAAETGKRSLAIGAPRRFEEAQKIDLRSLTWKQTVAPDGGRREARQTARIEVRSPQAAAVRLGLVWQGASDGVVLRFIERAAGDAATTLRAESETPIETVTVARLLARTPHAAEAWSPVLRGDTAVLEIDAPAGALPEAMLTLTRLSHLFIDGSALRSAASRRLADIGAAEACEVDLACNSDAALDLAADATGKLVFTKEDGSTHVCGGTLLNNTGDEAVPYLFSARHCIETAPEAASLNVYWSFRAAECNAGTAPTMQLQTGGAQLLASSIDWDWALFRLNETPPDGVTYAAWTTRSIKGGEETVTLHHPRGDLLKRSNGYIRRYYDSLSIGSSFIEAYWRLGATEIGSSGSALFTPHETRDYYEVRGGLMFGYSSCAASHLQDYYSRLDRMLPFVREYLTPTEAAPKGRVTVVEFYHRDLDHYFMSADADEIDALDTGRHRGWERTGLRFFAYDSEVRGASPVCRYYLMPEAGDSHFYSASPQECAEVAERFGESWIAESADVFHIPLPDTETGACPENTSPVWRFFHSEKTNHRYTSEISIRDTLRVTEGWIGEGYGPDEVIMCAPNPTP